MLHTKVNLRWVGVSLNVVTNNSQSDSLIKWHCGNYMTPAELTVTTFFVTFHGTREIHCRFNSMTRVMKVFAASVLLLMLVFLQAAPAAELQVTTNFPGGSAKIESIDQKTRTVQLIPGGPMERGWVCWWYFKLSGGTPAETITLDVGQTAMATPDQVFFSYDGREWRQTKHCKRNGERATYKQRIDQSEVYFAWGPPFVLSDAQTLVKDAAARSKHVTAFELTKSRDGRAVPGLRVSFPGAGGDKRHGFWIQARQHAWESGGSWVCRGLVEWLLSEEPRAVRLRTASDFTIIPIMDVDSVEAGNGGKQQQPHDHARDWCDKPHWPEVAAAIKGIRAMKAAGRFDGFVDLHNLSESTDGLARSQAPMWDHCRSAGMMIAWRASLRTVTLP